jgi:hypothetical protein
MTGQRRFSPMNIQGETRPLENPGGDKGLTFAIWGPWEDGAL